MIDSYSVFEILPRAMEVEVGENKRRGGDYYCDNVTLSFEEIGEHGDEEQYAQQDGEKALFVRQREADKTRKHLEGTAAIGYEHSHERVLAAQISQDYLALAQQEAREEEIDHAEDYLKKTGNTQHFCPFSHVHTPLIVHGLVPQHAGAVRAAGGGNGNFALAERALLGSRGGGGQPASS